MYMKKLSWLVIPTLAILFAFAVFFKTIYLDFSFLHSSYRNDPFVEKFVQDYYSVLPKNELKNGKQEVKIFKEAYFLLIDNYIYEFNNQAKEEFISKAIKSLHNQIAIMKNNKQPIEAIILRESVMNEIFNNIDAHTAWLSSTKAKEFKAGMSGKHEGIGVLFNYDKKRELIKVLKVFDSSPAKNSGIISGDYIVAVNGKVIDKSQKLDEIINSIRGEAGTTVNLTIERRNKPMEIAVVRGKYYVPSVEHHIINKKYAYITINSFNNDSASLFRSTLNAIGINDLEGLIIDVRNNPGGLLTGVVLIADNLISGELIVATKARHQDLNNSFNSTNKTFVRDNLPIIVLMNSMSASAAELLSGSLALNNRAILMGDYSFGKWSVQISLPLKDDSLLNITNQLFYAPKNSTFQGVGLAPDVLISSKDNLNFHEKDYPNYLKNDDVNNVNRQPKIKIADNMCPKVENPLEQKENDYILGCALLYFKYNSMKGFEKAIKSKDTNLER